MLTKNTSGFQEREANYSIPAVSLEDLILVPLCVALLLGQGLGLDFLDLGFRVYDLGFRVKGC